MIKQGRVCWKSPSNIALVKYWGKLGDQLPCNPSISMTLDRCASTTSISYCSIKSGHNPLVEFTFEGEMNIAFTLRVEQFIQKLGRIEPRLLDFDYQIASSNSFPHSAGIASSASAMSALALGLFSVLHDAEDVRPDNLSVCQKVSEWARLGSGSASRSLMGGYMVWGASSALQNSSNRYAIPLQSEIASVFKKMNDVVLIISKGAKKKSSSAGHALMEQHPYAGARYKHADENLTQLIDCMESGDFLQFATLVEHEALNLHGLMMSSSPAYMLLEPNTIAAIQKIQHYRKTTQLPICFTLDAGPNVHILFPNDVRTEAMAFINDSLKELCEEGTYIDDQIGKGPELLYHEST